MSKEISKELKTFSQSLSTLCTLYGIDCNNIVIDTLKPEISITYTPEWDDVQQSFVLWRTESFKCRSRACGNAVEKQNTLCITCKKLSKI
jgi:hypothetical protein